MDQPSIALYKRRLTYGVDLFVELVVRDIKVMYKRSVLGLTWSLLNPLLHLLIFYLLFARILSIRVNRFSSFTLTGLLVWGWFRSSITQGATAITGNRELLGRPGFPIAVLPVVTVTTSLIHFVLALPVLIAIMAIDGVLPGPMALMVPLIIALQFTLVLGLAYLAASANVLFADTHHLLNVVLQLLFYLTPVFYDMSSVPEQYLAIYRLRPMVRLLEAYRTLLIEGTQPEWWSLLAPSLLALGLLGVGYTVFTRASHRFVEEL
jgi:lipopolysaccharide transport system permease protein